MWQECSSIVVLQCPIKLPCSKIYMVCYSAFRFGTFLTVKPVAECSANFIKYLLTERKGVSPTCDRPRCQHDNRWKSF